MTISAASEQAFFAWALGANFPPPPSGLWLSLHHGDACDGSDQISGWAGGDRLLLAAADFKPADDGHGIVNTRALLFGVHTVSQRITGLALWDAASGGTAVFDTRLLQPLELAAGNPPVFFVGDLKLRIRP